MNLLQRLLTIGMSIAALSAPPSHAAIIYLDIPGIAGESSTSGFPGVIQRRREVVRQNVARVSLSCRSPERSGYC
jgi:hypothetical protein